MAVVRRTVQLDGVVLASIVVMVAIGFAALTLMVVSGVKVQWGSVADWVAGLATSGGLLFAGLQLRASRLERTSSERAYRQAMARSVSVYGTLAEHVDGRYRLKARVHNGGEFPIHGVVLLVIEPSEPFESWQGQLHSAIELIIGNVEAGARLREREWVKLGADPSFSELQSLCVLLFTDVWGDSWCRTPWSLERRREAALSC